MLGAEGVNGFDREQPRRKVRIARTGESEEPLI
jgi:hypothetical protein